MELSQPADWVEKSFIGYVLNTEFSDENAKVLTDLIKLIQDAFGGAVFCMPRQSLHITLLDWIAPLVNYGHDKPDLFTNIYSSYDKAMTEILSTVGPIEVQFDSIQVSPSTIYITGRDDGQFQDIRDRFVEAVELLPNTKLPPQIIHSSLARFTKPIDLGPVRAFAAGERLHLQQTVTDFRLTHTTREPLLEFETLKRYKLKS